MLGIQCIFKLNNIALDSLTISSYSITLLVILEIHRIILFIDGLGRAYKWKYRNCFSYGCGS